MLNRSETCGSTANDRNDGVAWLLGFNYCSCELCTWSASPSDRPSPSPPSQGVTLRPSPGTSSWAQRACTARRQCSHGSSRRSLHPWLAHSTQMSTCCDGQLGHDQRCRFPWNFSDFPGAGGRLTHMGKDCTIPRANRIRHTYLSPMAVTHFSWNTRGQHSQQIRSPPSPVSACVKQLLYISHVYSVGSKDSF
jgi:hypothetical protein